MKKSKKIKLTLTIILILSVLFQVSVLFYFKNENSASSSLNYLNSSSLKDLDWQPKDKPRWFHFEEENNDFNFFREIIVNKVDSPNSMDSIVKLMTFIRKTGGDKGNGSDWYASPVETYKLAEQGYMVNCGHYGMLFSTFAQSIGFKVRDWSLEGNDGIGGNSHFVNEVFIPELNKWVMFDTTNMLYFNVNNTPASLIELRNEMLEGDIQNIKVADIKNSFLSNNDAINYYHNLLVSINLYTRSDYINLSKPRSEYGVLSFAYKLLDKAPEQFRKFIILSFGLNNHIIHFADNNSPAYNVLLPKVLYYSFSILAILELFILLFIIPGCHRKQLPGI